MIRVETRVTAERFRDFYHFHIFQGPGLYIVSYFFIVAALMITPIILTNFPEYYMNGILGVAFLYFYVLLFVFSITTSSLQQKKDLLDPKDEIVFGESEVSIVSNSEMLNESSLIEYDTFYKIYETKDAFYLYMTLTRAYIVPKKDIVEGTGDHLRACLQRKIPSKKFSRRR